VTTRKPVRVMKARTSARLPGCGHWVTAGHLIARDRSGRWSCIECRIAALKATEQLMTTPPRPSERDDTTKEEAP
jgi:hypothetical protein